MNSFPCRPTIGACPFCNQPFISAGALTNHLENRHPNLQHRPPKRKRANSHPTDPGTTRDSTDATRSPNNQSFEDELRQLFSEFVDFTPAEDGHKPQQAQSEEITYHHDNENVDREGTESDTVKPIEHFPSDRQAGKAITAYPFVRERQSMYNFFRPFQNGLDFKLARFFYTAHVPKARIDEFFKEGFLAKKTDAQWRSTISFQSAHTLYRKIDDMITDPQWKNGFVDFRLAKNTEFWYRDILESLKYMLRRKSLAAHMSWAPTRHFDTHGERVYTEMNTASWWWDTQVWTLRIPPYFGY